MHQKHAGRLTVIGIVLSLALLGIYLHGLKPGIDIVGGTSLLYEIKAPPGANQDLAEQVAAVLKKRVDPDGVRNLIWRPQGATRLEIQMPASAVSHQAAGAREQFTKTREVLADLGVRSAEVKAMLQIADPAAQQKEIARLAGGSPWLSDLLTRLAAVEAEYRKALAANDNDRAINVLEPQKQQLEKQLADANVSVQQFESYLELTRAAIEKAQKEGKKDEIDKRQKERQAKIQEMIQKAPNFPARTAAIEQFVGAFDQYSKYKGTVDDAEDLKRLLKGSGVLEFHILVSLGTSEAQAMIKRLHEKGPAPLPGDTLRWYEVDRPEEMTGHQMVDFADKKWVLASIKPEDSMINRPGAPPWGLQRAFPEFDYRSNRPVVGFEFDAQGASLFGQLTGTHINQPLAIVLDDKIISAPNIQSRIERQGIITGDRSEKDRQYLISTLNAGSLPARLAEEPISERTIGPQLGADNLRAGLVACIVGLFVVATFLIGYYYMAGVVATLAVLMNMVLILGIMAAFNATFTLPGIAAMVLTVGMAVDANVLIFERLREEQLRGLSIRMALHNAYDRAFSAILDSNVTTAITSLLLYWLGSEEVKGFGLTLLLGILSSLFTALFVTRTIFNILIDKFNLKNLGSLPLTFPRWDQALRPRIDWMGKAWIFMVFSLVITVTGLSAFFVKGRDMFDIEFVSGTGVQFELKEKTPRPRVQALVEPFEKQGLPSAQVVAVGTDQVTYEIVTPNPEAAQVKAAIMKALGERLKLDQPSRFTGVGEKIDQAMAHKVVVPITADNLPLLRTAGADESELQRHRGGVAVILSNIDPPLPTDVIAKRINAARLQPDRQKEPYRKIDISAPKPGPGQAAGSGAVILASDESLHYEKVPENWQVELARPLWELAQDAIHKPAELQKVTNFDAQVASETMRAGVMALVISILLIMVYIWFRFGNLKYAAATVVALLHDTLITVGMIGLSHFLANTAVGHALLIEPFRMNLTLLAAVLTVMGYSMNDTIVVFDRIRENRGRFGHLSKSIINDSINQTLSRTLLTGGTTIITVFVMYIQGGPGIHGFTFALLVGILVGTYSSIAIASPILLLGKEPGAVEARAARGTLQPASG